MKRDQPHTEIVMIGQEHLGRIHLTDRGYETFGQRDEYLATHVTIEGARRALFELHRDSEQGLATR